MPNAPGEGTPTIPGGNSQGGGIANSAGKTVLFPTDTVSAKVKTAQDNGQGDITQAQINPDNPPAQKTLVYSPDVRVVIAHGAQQIDVSSDIVRCSIHRAESSAATFFMTLSNKGLRYTPKKGTPMFSRMDRIVVYMKRTDMRQVFSGYLDTVPYKQLYPGTVDFKATCTVKRLMHTWWNPALLSSSSLLNQMSTATGLGGDGQNGNDSGLGSMLRRLLVLVGGWKVENIHIQNFPTLFYEFLKSQANKDQKVNDEAVNKFETLLLGSDHSPAPGAQAGHNPNAGTPGPATGSGPGSPSPPGTGTNFYVQQIIAACDERGLGPLVSDNNLSAGLAQAGETGTNSMSPSQQKAWQQVQQTNLDAQQANRNSDAAIIGAAVAAVETGGGVAIRNLYNPAVPGSDKFPNDGPGTDHDSCGIFQQRNFAEWGDVSQRMNPKQAAGMFFEHLASMVPNWRNIDPGAAGQQVQRSAGAQAQYSAAVAWATPVVQQIRRGQAGPASATVGGAAGTSTPGPINAPSGAGAAPSTNVNLTPAAPSIGPGAAGVPGLPSPAASTKPHPDSEGAVQFALRQTGHIPYVWGGKGPNSFDCSGLVSAAFASIGISVPSQTDAIRASVQEIPKSQAGRGDIYEPATHHVSILLGPPGTTIVEAATNSVPLPQQIRQHAWYSEGGYEWYGRVCMNGGPDPSSPFNSTSVGGTGGGSGGGTTPGALDQQSGTGTTMGSSGSDEGIARNLFSYIFTPGQFSADVADMLPGEKAFIDGQPLIQIVQAIAGASLRKFQSAPNGDLMFYYPDWFGLDGKPAVYRLEDIELKDVRIDFSDDPLTTHVYVEGDYSMLGQSEQMLAWLDTAGVATVEDTWLYQRLIKMAPGDPETASGEELMRRYGVRPLKQSYAMAGTHELEFLLAAQIFMEKWAQQFQTSISMTFMPELLPGMRIELAGHNLSVYVTEVTHVCDFQNGFSTQAVIMAPANPNGKALMSTVSSTVDQGLIDTLVPGAGGAFTDPLGGQNTAVAAAGGPS
jgi:cell wall-associated NlpC family hydrolase